MSFKVDIRDYSKEFKKTKFFDWTPGPHRFRVLGDEAPLIQSYWFGRGFIQSNGYDDPQGTLNRRIKLENPDTYRDNNQWRPIQDRYYLNVYDMTPAKICPNCEREVKANNGTFPAICPSCGVGVVSNLEAKPLNQVRVLTSGKKLFEQFPSLEHKYVDENDEPIPINTYDCIMHVVGTGSNRSTVVLADVDDKDKPKTYEIEVPPEDLFDLYSIVPKITDEEMEQLISGVSLKDIFASRREEDTDEESETPKRSLEEAKKRVDEIFP